MKNKYWIILGSIVIMICLLSLLNFKAESKIQDKQNLEKSTDKYNYIPSTGSVIKSKGKVYILNSPIKKTINKNTITLENVIVDTGNNSIQTRIEGTGKTALKNAEIKIKDKIIKTDNYSLGSGGDSWTVGHSFDKDVKYYKGDTIKYIIHFRDGEVSFDINLDEVKSVSSYSELGSTNVKENIAITAVVKENKNLLDVDFLGLLKDQNVDISDYGNGIYKDEYDNKINLKDAEGKIIKGKLVRHPDRANHFQFDTTNLKKPYTIIIPKVKLYLYGEKKSNNKIKIKLPKKGIEKVNKSIKLNGDNENIIKENNTVNIVSIEKKENNQYEMKLNFPQNKNSKFKISSIELDAVKSLFNIKNDFSGYGSTLSDEGIVEDIIIEPEHKNKDNINFYIYPKEYIVEGNWNIKIMN